MPAPACTMLPSSALRYTAPSWPPKVSLHPVTLGGARWGPSLAHRRPKGSPVHFHPKDLTWNASTQQVLYDILKTLNKCHDFEVVEPQRQDTFCAAKIRQRLSGILSALAFCGGPCWSYQPLSAVMPRLGGRLHRSAALPAGHPKAQLGPPSEHGQSSGSFSLRSTSHPKIKHPWCPCCH